MKKRVRISDLIKPRRVEVEDLNQAESYGKFVAEPLERGFGITIGNCLRRILLSSIEGAAITSVNIENVMHEFSTIPGVMEDVTEIVLNLKSVRIRLDEKDEARLSIDVQGPCEVKAGMFSVEAGAAIVNPDAHIATLAEGAKLKMEALVKSGRGYVAADKVRDESAPTGTIFLDAIFSPVRRVNHIVTNARVGQRTDYDCLEMEIWTDGTIDPGSAVAQAALILQDQLALFVGDSLIIEDEPSGNEDGEKKKFNENLYRRIDEIELSVRSANCLENIGIKYISELAQMTEAELLRTKNFGRKSLSEIKERLVEMGLSLGMKLEGFPTREQLDQMKELTEPVMA